MFRFGHEQLCRSSTLLGLLGVALLLCLLTIAIIVNLIGESIKYAINTKTVRKRSPQFTFK